MPLGANDEHYRGRTASRGVFLSWCGALLGWIRSSLDEMISRSGFDAFYYLRLAASLGSKQPKEQHKRHGVYTGLGHHCGVTPYSSLWSGGLPHGLMMNNTRKNCLTRGVLVLVVVARVLLLDLSDRSPDAPMVRSHLLPWGWLVLFIGGGPGPLPKY